MPILTRESKKDGSKTYIPYINVCEKGKCKKVYGGTYSKFNDAKTVLKKMEFDSELVHREKEKITSIDEQYDRATGRGYKHLTWDEIFETFIEYKQSQGIGFSQISHIQTRYRKYIQPRFGNKKIAFLKKAEVISFQSYLVKLNQSETSYNREGHLKPATINKIMEVMKSMFNFANDMYEMNLKSPFIVKPIKEEEYRSDFYTEEEFYQFISVVRDPMERILFSVLFYTGLRIGEATALSFNDVIGKDRCILINKTRKHAAKYDKNNSIGKPKTQSSVRTIYIDEQIEKMIMDYRNSLMETCPDYSDDWFIFGGKSPIAYSTLRRHNHKYAEQAGLRPIRIHDYRGSFTTNLFTYTTNIKVVSKLLGHSDVETTTKYYLKIKDDDKKELISKVSGNRKIRLEL